MSGAIEVENKGNMAVAVTSAGIFEIINGMAMPLPNYGYAL